MSWGEVTRDLLHILHQIWLYMLNLTWVWRCLIVFQMLCDFSGNSRVSFMFYCSAWNRDLTAVCLPVKKTQEKLRLSSIAPWCGITAVISVMTVGHQIKAGWGALSPLLWIINSLDRSTFFSSSSQTSDPQKKHKNIWHLCRTVSTFYFTWDKREVLYPNADE